MPHTKGHTVSLKSVILYYHATHKGTHCTCRCVCNENKFTTREIVFLEAACLATTIPPRVKRGGGGRGGGGAHETIMEFYRARLPTVL